MVANPKQLSPTAHLERRIRELDIEADRVQAEYGDPSQALGAFLLAWIGLEALEETYQEYVRHEDSFLFDDYDEDEDTGRPD